VTANYVCDSVFKDTGNVLLSRARGSDGNYISQASLASITCTVSDLTDPTQAVYSPALTVAATVLDAIRLDPRWTLDAIGFNFLHVMPAAAYPIADHVYSVFYLATPVAGPVFAIGAFRITAEA
jgi:hypothetical protein